MAAMLGKEMLGVPVVFKVAGPGVGVKKGFKGWPGHAEEKGRAKRRLKIRFAAALRRGHVRILRQTRNAKWYRWAQRQEARS